MPRLSKEEKIRKLEAQIQAIKEDRNDNILFENKYFFIRKESSRWTKLSMKSYTAVYRKECKGFTVPTNNDDDMEKWLSAAEEAVKRYISIKNNESEDHA